MKICPLEKKDFYSIETECKYVNTTNILEKNPSTPTGPNNSKFEEEFSTFENMDGLICLYTNADSLRNKMMELNDEMMEKGT